MAQPAGGVMNGVLVIDIGNTSVAAAWAVGGRLGRIHRWPTAEPRPGAVATFLKGVVGRQAGGGAIVGCVAPAVMDVWRRAAARVTGAGAVMVMDRSLRLGVGIDYPDPDSIGADRLANAHAAVMRYGRPVIVADFGTALTFDVVNGRGDYIGGVIAPGPALMADYLAERTALLPRIRLGGAIGAVGRGTAGAMRIGARIGYRGMVREIVAHLRRTAGLRQAVLCATGGHAPWVLRGIGLPFRIDPKLTLRGLADIYRINAPDSPGRGAARAPRPAADHSRSL